MFLLVSGTGTFAGFSDVEVSSDNQVNMGTMDLVLGDNDEDFRNGVSETWTMNNMRPGSSSVTTKLYLKNVGSLDGDHIEISFTNEDIEMGNEEYDTLNGAQGMDKYIKIVSMSYDDEHLYASLEDKNGNGRIDLDDLEKQSPFDDLKPPNENSGVSQEFLEMSLKFVSAANNDYQGDKLVTNVTVTLNQEESQ